MRSRDRREAAAREALARARAGGEAGDRVGQRAGVAAGTGRPVRAVSDQLGRPARADGDDRQPRACASSTTCPNVSVCEQKRKRSALA